MILPAVLEYSLRLNRLILLGVPEMNGGLFAQRINWHQALAEVLLIIAGILIALAAQNWWEERVEREAEISYLEALRSDFEANRESLEASIRTQQNLVNEGDELLNLMKAGLADRSSEEFFSKPNHDATFFWNKPYPNPGFCTIAPLWTSKWF